MQDRRKKEDILEIKPYVFETKIREKDEIDLAENIKITILKAEYYDRDGGKRPRTIVLKVSAPSRYPIVRPEYRDEDVEKWRALAEHSDRISSKRVRRFFYEERKRDVLEINGYKLIIFPFFNLPEAEKLYQQGYLCNLRIVYPRAII